MDDFKSFWLLALVIWGFSALLGIGLVGAIIWGIVKLVTHFT